MSGISSGVGLVSGIETAKLIDQLIAIERRPINTLQGRVDALAVQRAAFLELSARLLAVQNAVVGFSRKSFFRQFQAVSSNENVVRAQATEAAAPGSITFRVRSLVSNHAVISRGFTDADRTPVGAGRVSIEIGGGRVDPATPLDVLNGGTGVRRGSIAITDRGGNTVLIDLSGTVTVRDVLKAINDQPSIKVQASVQSLPANGVSGDRIVLTDLTPEADATHRLTVSDVDAGRTATDLGLAGSVEAARLDGRDLIRLTHSTPLSRLNDGNGVDRLTAGPDLEISTNLGDFSVTLTDTLATALDTDLRVLNSGGGVSAGTIRITDRTGQQAQIDLSGARTVRDVLDAINNAGLDVRANVVNSSIQVTDTSGVDPDAANGRTLSVEDVSGSAAADLGIDGSTTDPALTGREIYRMRTLGDVLRAINFAPGNEGLVEASISSDGKRIVLQAVGEGNTVTVRAGHDADGNESHAVRDLGLVGAAASQPVGPTLESRRLIAGLNTVLLGSLNGGRGVTTGEVRFVDRSGNAATIDFSGAETLQEVIDRINAEDTVALTAAINDAGTGIILRDTGGGSAAMSVTDVSGTLAAELHITTDDNANLASPDAIDGGNLQLQYVSRATPLSSLGAGRGVSSGSFRITDSTGAAFEVTVDAAVTTVGKLIDRINAATPDTLIARINDTGDGIVLVDSSGGSSVLTVEDVPGSRTARDLRLAGQAADGEHFIDGSFEVRVALGATDTLSDLVRKLNEADAGLSASVLHHGGALNPFSLTITSSVAGRGGEMLFDVSGLDLGLTLLSDARDAVITIGDGSSGAPIVVTSDQNTIRDVLDGVTLDLLSTSEEPVTVTVGQDVDSIVEALQKFVDDYNRVLDAIAEQTRFDPESLDRGPLLSDPTVSLIRSRLTRIILRPIEGADPAFAHLFSAGLRLAEGNRLALDEEQFRAAYEAAPDAVEALFTREGAGFGAGLQKTIEDLTRDFDGLIAQKDSALVDQQEILHRRMESLNVLLDARRARLEAQFLALESALAALQQQQNALATLAQLAATGGSAIG